MNYDKAREIKSGANAGKWHYTRMNDGVIWPIGFCSEGCSGHDTPEEACEHYRRYLLSNLRIQGPKTERWPKEKCAVEGCETEATHLLSVDCWKYWEVCEAHATKETAETLVPKVGESWHS